MPSNTQFPEHVTLPEWPVTLIREVVPTDLIWLVGGTVRDLLINRPLHDWDFVSPASGIRLAKRVADAFKGAFYVLDQSRKTGRAIVHAPDSAQPITLDFAMLRDSTLNNDLAKRDFTVNAMAMSLSGKVLDPLNFRSDLDKRIIRMTSGDCFTQDPLRLLRAVRQSQSLEFGIEPATYNAICQQAYLICSVSPERILSELCALLGNHLTSFGFDLLEKTNILRYIIPEIEFDTQRPDGIADGLPHSWHSMVSTLSTTDHLLSFIYGRENHAEVPAKLNALWHIIEPQIIIFQGLLREYFSESVNVDINRSILLKWALLMSNVPIEATRLRLTELRMPNKSQNTIETVIQTYRMFRQMSDNVSRREIYRFYKQAGKAGPAVVIFAIALALASSEDTVLPQGLIHRAHVLLQAYFEQAEEFISPLPLLRGDDLVELGIQPGPAIGVMLDLLLEAQVTGLVTSRASAVDFILDPSHPAS